MIHAIFSLLLLFSASQLVSGQSGPLTGYPDCVNGPLAKVAICDSSLDEVTRARSIVALLNVSEKITRVGESYGLNQIDRIGLPPYHWRQNSVHGLGPGVIWTATGEDYSNCTMFPHVINQAASFDREIMFDIAAAISDEARAFANVGRAGLDWFAPNINIFRDPRWGRGQETPGEDPYLSGEFAVQFVRGLQTGEDSRYYKTVADCKHYAGYDLEHWGGEDRSNYNAIINDQDLVETYLPSFESCVKDGKVGSLMCSYNSVNGIPSCANSFFIETILRDHWNMDPYVWVVSDCGAIEEIFTTHHYTQTETEAVAAGLKAGVDIDCGPWYSKWGNQAYAEGLINDSDLDTALVRQFVSLVRMGYFDAGENQPYRQYDKSKINSDAHHSLALQSARESMVLLKNINYTLPINPKSVTTIALIGPNADATGQLLGNYEAPAPFIISIQQALEEYSSQGIKINYAQGCEINSTKTSGFKAAIAIAQEADVVIYVGGIDTHIEYEGHDRPTIDLPGQQLSLLSQLSQVAKSPIVTVMIGAGSLDLSQLKADNNIGSIVWAGYPGQSGGQAVIDVLMGVFSPSGRLVSTHYPADYVNQVPMTDQSMRASDTNPGRTYKFYTGEPVFAFGDGLSYSDFTITLGNSTQPVKSIYSIDELIKNAAIDDRLSDISYYLNITNNGPMVSDVTALAFLSSSSINYENISPPIKTLFDFTHQHSVKVGETRSVWLSLTYRQLVHTDNDGHQWLIPGDYKIMIDNDSKYENCFTLIGEPALVKAWPGAKNSPKYPVIKINKNSSPLVSAA